MAKTITDLRERLFDALDGLANGKMDVATARAVSDLSQTIINSAKVEVEARKALDMTEEVEFLGATALPAPREKDVIEEGKGYTVRQHRLK